MNTPPYTGCIALSPCSLRLFAPLFVLLLFFHTTHTYANPTFQLSPKDSLANYLSGLSEKERVRALNTLANQTAFTYPDSSIQYALQADALSQELGMLEELSKANSNLGIAYHFLHQYDSSLYYFLEYLILAQNLGKDLDIGNAHNNLAVVYQVVNYPEKAVYHHRQSLRYKTKLGDSVRMALNMAQMANLWLGLKGINDSAIHYLTQAELLLKDQNNLMAREFMAYVHEGYGRVAMRNEDYSRAINHLLTAEKRFLTSDDRYHLFLVQTYLADCFMRENKNQQAQRYLNLANDNAQILETPEAKAQIYLLKSRWAESQNKLDEALAYHQLYVEYNNQFLDLEKARHIAAIQTQSEFFQQREALAALSEVSEVQKQHLKSERTLRNVLFISIAVLVSLTLIMLRSNWRARKSNKILEQKREEIKKKNLEIVHQKYKALRASRAKSQFLSMMSHEIRTPMNAVIGMTNLLLEEEPRDDQEENLRTLKFSAENLMVLINDVLDYSKIEAEKIEFEYIGFDLRELISSVSASLRGKAREKNLMLYTHIDDQIPNYVKGDPTRLAQVLNNLLSNAIKFTEQGRVEISADLVKQEGDTVKIQFAVLDTGIGIPKEKQREVFESFTQATSDITRRYGGTGLGLAITKRLLELQGSRILVDSEEDKGAKFYFTLTLNKAQTPKLPGIPVLPPTLPSLEGIHILLAEDNPVNEKVASRFLNKWGVEVDHVVNGKEAVEQVQEKEYALVLMDIQMPVMDGLRATKIIRELPDAKYKELPIVALTASAMQEVREQAYKAGVTDFITKPFNPEELRAILSKYVLREKSTDL